MCMKPLTPKYTHVNMVYYACVHKCECMFLQQGGINVNIREVEIHYDICKLSFIFV